MRLWLMYAACVLLLVWSVALRCLWLGHSAHSLQQRHRDITCTFILSAATARATLILATIWFKRHFTVMSSFCCCCLQIFRFNGPSGSTFHIIRWLSFLSCSRTFFFVCLVSYVSFLYFFYFWMMMMLKSFFYRQHVFLSVFTFLPYFLFSVR